MTLGRNEPCHCGSGKKYKRCCLDRDAGWRTPEQRAEAAAAFKADCERRAAESRARYKCARTACDEEATSGRHRDSGLRYCERCRQRINAANPLPDGGELIPKGLFLTDARPRRRRPLATALLALGMIEAASARDER